MTDTELHDTLKAAIEPKLKEQFTIGMKAGYDAAMVYIYRATKDVTSAKAIKQLIKKKVDEGAARHIADKEENNE